ncbi:MAG: tetratricopeptide repeat protein [Devosia sp.]|nr:tetratricopeptide repeat protein [Devosia sp.]
MAKLVHLFAGTLLMVSGLALSGAVATAQSEIAPPLANPETFEPIDPGVTGSFLAGEQALKDLRTSEAASFFMAAAQGDWDNPLLVERAFIAQAADGQISASASTAEHLLEFDPGNQLAAVVIAVEAMKQGEFDAVVQAVGGIGDDSFNAITAQLLAAWAMTGKGDVDGASELLDELDDAGLRDFSVYHRALMLDVAGRSDEAIGFAAEALAVTPLDPRLVEANARILANAGRFDDANAVIAAYEARGFSDPLLTALKTKLAAGEKPGLFLSTAQGGAAELFYSFGEVLLQDGSADVAMMYMQFARYLDPKSDIATMGYGQLLDFSGQNEAANRIYDSIPATSPLKPGAVVRIAQNLDLLGDRPEALRRLGNIVATNPDDMTAATAYGDLLRYDEQYAEAAVNYGKALDAKPGDVASDWRIYYVRGIAYERAGEWPKAEADFLKALDLNPGEPDVLNYLGYSWIDQDMNFDQALGLIEEAVAAVPNNGYIVDSLGWAFYKLGRLDEAVSVLETAVQLMPTDPEINDHLGDAYWRIGRTLEARFQWNIASSLDEDDGPVRARVTSKLINGLPPLEPLTEAMTQ